MPEPTTDPTPASMGEPLSEAEPLTEERLARIEHLWGGHQAYVREMLAEIRRLRAMKCATCGKRIGYLNHKGYLLGWGCADAERCDQGLPHRFDTERGEVLVEDSWFKVGDLPDILGNFMRSAAEQGRAAKALSMKLAEARARVGVLEGQLATARALHKPERRYTPDDGESSYATYAEAADASFDGTGRPAMVTFFEVCSHCAAIEMAEGCDHQYKESLWPCKEGVALGLDGGGSDA